MGYFEDRVLDSSASFDGRPLQFHCQTDIGVLVAILYVRGIIEAVLQGCPVNPYAEYGLGQDGYFVGSPPIILWALHKDGCHEANVSHYFGKVYCGGWRREGRRLSGVWGFMDDSSWRSVVCRSSH